MARKSYHDISQVINILKTRGLDREYNFIPIDNCSEEDVAKILSESLMFLCFGTFEGFQLPPAEAMACGCIVIGYHGQGSKEFLKKDISFPVETGNILSFVKTIEAMKRNIVS